MSANPLIIPQILVNSVFLKLFSIKNKEGIIETKISLFTLQIDIEIYTNV